MEFVDYIKTPNINKVILHRWLHPVVEGTLCISSHNLILSSRKDNKEELWLLHRLVDKVERKIGLTSGTIVLKCKDFRIIHLEIPNIEECNNVANSIEWLSNIEKLHYLYPFFYRALFDIKEDGWQSFSVESEFSKLSFKSNDWRISDINKDYKVCPTYPKYVIVPKNIDDNVLIAISNFRQAQRFPVLSYYHATSQAALLRSSQPLVGPNTRRCKDDERLLNAALRSGKKGYIIDLRTQGLAHFARTKGGGFEPEVNYPLWKRLHQPIENHSGFMDSLTKLIDGATDTNSTMDKWLSRLDSSGWLAHVKDVLTCACLVAQSLDQNQSSVLVHGGEGFDTTLQVCSLAQIILNPDCRTIQGLENLIENEWLLAGHPFASRCRHGPYSSVKDQSPSFLLFLDCLFQIHQQFPCSFEFNEQFLIVIFEHAYASQFGTFIGNCDKERRDIGLAEKTVSFWSYINRPEKLAVFLNPVYEPNNKVIWPSVAPQSLVLWSGMYLKWVCDNKHQKEAWDSIGKIREYDQELQTKVIKLRRKLLELKQEAIEVGILSQSDGELSPPLN